MEKAKGAYWQASATASMPVKDSITGNLHAFCEMSLDRQGNPGMGVLQY